jgi:hypothetical protein
MSKENYSDEYSNQFISKYGFLLSIINKTVTDKFQNDLYRVRITDKKEKIVEPTQLSYPKNNITIGRCNLVNQPVFYCSDKSTTAIAEILKYRNPLNQYLYLSVWKFIPENDLIIFTLLEKAIKKGLVKDMDILKIIPDKIKRRKASQQLSEIEKYFYDFDHFKSATICDTLFNRSVLPCDCIFYPSAIETELGINISMKAEIADKLLSFQRAYKLELFEDVENHKIEVLGYTLSKTDFKWKKPNPNDLIFRTLIKEDLGII